MAKKKKAFFEGELYTKLSVNQLILFSIYSITLNKKNCTFEELVERCFISFPETFRFENIKKWPDSRKLDRPLRTLRSKRLIGSDLEDNIALTNLGRKSAKQIAKNLTQKKLF